MKKYLQTFILFFILSTLTFAKWETIQIFDEFKEKEIANRIITYPIKTEPIQDAGLAIEKNEFINYEYYTFLFVITTTIKSEKLENSEKLKVTLKVKTENSNPEELTGYIANVNKQLRTTIITGLLEEKTLELLKKNKILKIVYEDEYSIKYYVEFDITALEESIKTLHVPNK